MSVFRIKQGKNIKIKGEAGKEIVPLSLPAKAAILPADFRGLKPRLAVKEGELVKAGSPIITDKTHPEISVAAPVSGKVVAINRGEKRVLQSIVIETDSAQEKISHKKYSYSELKNIAREEVKKTLLGGGLWPALRQRPFSRVADPQAKPKSIFVHAMTSEPLAPEIDFILEGKEQEFQAGLDILGRLTEGKVYLCTAGNVKSKALTQSKNVEIHQFVGPHPAGNVGTHIHYLDPIKKGDVLWYIEAADVLRVAKLFLEGVYSAEKIVAITGEGAKNKVYVKTIIGAPMSKLLEGSGLDNMRCISGSILTGKTAGKDGYLGYYDSQVTVIPEGGARRFLGWLVPGFNEYTFSHTYASAFFPKPEYSLDTDENGGHRAIVLNHIYDSLVALDVYTYFLIKAIISGDVEMSEKLGILECDDEDFALCTFACPSKTDVGAIIRQGLDVIEKEG